jgi:hypothetical protein
VKTHAFQKVNGGAAEVAPGLVLALGLVLSGCFQAPQFGAAAESQLRDTSRPTGVVSGSHTSLTSQESTDQDADGGTVAQEPEPEPQPMGGGAGAGAPPVASTAPDDSVRCGNGVVDQNETCDVSIDQGLPGHCPLSCPASDPCHPLELMLRGCATRCVPAAPPAGAACM